MFLGRTFSLFINSCRTSSKLKLGFFLLFSLAAEANQVDLMVAIPLNLPHLELVQHRITNLQKHLSQASSQTGYDFRTDWTPPSKFHITLEGVLNIDSKLLNRYAECIESVIPAFEYFDLTDALNNGHFELYGEDETTGALTLPVSKKSPLYKLAISLRRCFQTKNLPVGSFPNFKAHISLGKFSKNKYISYPTANNLAWAPNFQSDLPKESFLVTSILFKARKANVPQRKGSSEWIEDLEKLFSLGVKDGSKDVSTLDVTTAWPISNIELLDRTVTSQFENAIETNIGLVGKRLAVKKLLLEVVTKFHSVSELDAYKFIGDFNYVGVIFNSVLLERKEVDPSVILTESDTWIFYSFPEELQKYLMQKFRVTPAFKRRTNVISADNDNKENTIEVLHPKLQDGVISKRQVFMDLTSVNSMVPLALKAMKLRMKSDVAVKAAKAKKAAEKNRVKQLAKAEKKAARAKKKEDKKAAAQKAIEAKQAADRLAAAKRAEEQRRFEEKTRAAELADRALKEATAKLEAERRTAERLAKEKMVAAKQMAPTKVAKTGGKKAARKALGDALAAQKAAQNKTAKEKIAANQRVVEAKAKLASEQNRVAQKKANAKKASQKNGSTNPPSQPSKAEKKAKAKLAAETNRAKQLAESAKKKAAQKKSGLKKSG